MYCEIIDGLVYPVKNVDETTVGFGKRYYKLLLPNILVGFTYLYNYEIVGDTVVIDGRNPTPEGKQYLNDLSQMA
ncbi:MAG: hypothetical protein RR086_03695 [Clostridia bacterium]